MNKRIVVVGGVAAGATAAAKARRTNEQAEIVLVEAGPYMSFANCGLPYYVGGEIPRRDDLFVTNPRRFGRRYKVEVRLNAEVVSISRGRRSVELRGESGAAEALGYDRLVLATGAVPIRPAIEGLADCANLFFCRTVPDADAMVTRIEELAPGRAKTAESRGAGPSDPRALIIGGGYVGLECAEQLLARGFKVTVVELLGQLMSSLDPEMAQPLQQALTEAGAEIILNDGVTKLTGGDLPGPTAVLRSGRQVPFDLAILAVGVKPNVALAKAAGLELGPTGAIAVDTYQRSSDPAIYAAGDNCQSVFLPTGKAVNIPLAGPAIKQGRTAGANTALDLMAAPDDDPRRLTFAGVLGTAVVRVCGKVAGGTGLSERAARREGLDVGVSYAFGSNHATYYPRAEYMLVKTIYRPADGRLLGAQVAGGEGVDKRLDVFAAAIHGGLTVEDLEQLDLCYAPPFGSARDAASLAGLVAANARRGIAPAIGPAQLLQEMEGEHPPIVLDVRTPGEYRRENIPGALNLPVDALRERIQEVPADRPVVLQCNVGYRSYIAQQILRNHGRRNVRNLLGGYVLFHPVREMKHREG
ncbi:MAG: hypothetical protein AMJ81_08275 [Phycisphaerae bacterium SM23_33]|nr:MAG: hypothetical protein AMJ81_08275 [Phycisphaerae bacterium SM23_33]